MGNRGDRVVPTGHILFITAVLCLGISLLVVHYVKSSAIVYNLGVDVRELMVEQEVTNSTPPVPTNGAEQEQVNSANQTPAGEAPPAPTVEAPITEVSLAPSPTNGTP